VLSGEKNDTKSTQKNKRKQTMKGRGFHIARCITERGKFFERKEGGWGHGENRGEVAAKNGSERVGDGR